MSLRDRSLSASPPRRDRLGSTAYRRHNGPRRPYGAGVYSTRAKRAPLAHGTPQNVVLKTPYGEAKFKTNSTKTEVLERPFFRQ
jgi:hypothetical protein